MAEYSETKALKSGIWYTIANFVSKGILFLSMPIFTRLLTKSEVGDYSNFATWLSILSSIITLDLFTSVILAKFDFKDKFNEYITSILVLGSAVTLIFYFIAIIFESSIKNLLGFDTLEFHLLFAYSIFSPAMTIFEMRNRVEYKYKSTVVISMGSTVLCTLISVLCATMFSDKLLGRLVGFYVPSLIINVLVYIFLFKKCNWFNLVYWKYALAISIPMIIHVLSGRLLSSCDRVMIRSICGTEDTAMYSVAYSCCMIISVFWNSISSAWTPWAIEQMNNSTYDKLRKASKPYMIFVGGCMVCFLLIAPEVLYLMGGEGYKAAIAIIPPVVIGNIFQFGYSLYVNIETYLKKQKYIAIGTAIAAVINVILNYVCIPIYGYIAAAYTTLVGYVVLFFIHFVIVRKLGYTSWFDTKFNLIYLMFFSFMIPLFYVLYYLNIVRYILIGIIFVACAVIIIHNYKEIKQAIQTKSFEKLLSKINF